jgi:hypothetical protein
MSVLRDRSIFLSVENEGLLERISTLKNALHVLDKKYRHLKNLHSKCSSKRKIKFLYR